MTKEKKKNPNAVSACDTVSDMGETYSLKTDDQSKDYSFFQTAINSHSLV